MIHHWFRDRLRSSAAAMKRTVMPISRLAPMTGSKSTIRTTVDNNIFDSSTDLTKKHWVLQPKKLGNWVPLRWARGPTSCVGYRYYSRHPLAADFFFEM